LEDRKWGGGCDKYCAIGIEGKIHTYVVTYMYQCTTIYAEYK